MPELRDYQQRAIEMLRESFGGGARAPLLVLPTGAGKTVIAAEIVRSAAARGSRVLFLAPRRELVRQASGKFHAIGIEHGVILAGSRELERLYERVQVASVDTLLSRLVRAPEHRRLPLPDFDLVIIDEAHLAPTEKRGELLALWPKAKLAGLTATPARKDGRALGTLFDALVEPTTPAELTDAGYLVRARYWSLTKPDLARVQVRSGDYAPCDLERAMNRPKLVGDVVETWLEKAHDRRTIVFACSVAHSIALAERFQRLGIAAEHVDGETDQRERKDVFERFDDGRLQVLVNCAIATFGVDVPAVSCIVLARPTKSVPLHLQMLGRGLRIAPGKADCLVLDHAGNVLVHGPAIEPRVWTLDGLQSLTAQERLHAAGSDGRMVKCSECHALYTGLPECPECGYRPPPRGRDVVTVPGSLVQLGGATTDRDSIEIRMQFYRELLGHAVERKFKLGFAAHKYRERYGEKSPWDWRHLAPASPSMETARWLKSRQIAFARAAAARPRAA